MKGQNTRGQVETLITYAWDTVGTGGNNQESDRWRLSVLIQEDNEN